MIVNNVSALDRLFWKRAQASILQSPKIRAGVTRSLEHWLGADADRRKFRSRM
jgi:hypothetical protein